MTKLSVETFIDLLRKSELTDDLRLEDALRQIVSEAGGAENVRDADFLASALVKKGLVTRWHVRQLMKHRYKGFYLRQYRIMDHLGTGGMSTVYLAEHTVMHRRVAIKVLPKSRVAKSKAYLDRFLLEAQAIASLNHPHIIQAYDIDRLDDIHYIVMEYFEGNNLRQLVDKEGPLPYEDAVSYIRQGAEGLVHAHRIGVIHRDVKPENILANAEGTAKILDLGLALLDEGNLEDESQKDKILGTADYLAPEQAINSSNIDARADIYALGCTLYFCLTGHPPFPFGTIADRLIAHQRENPASIQIDRPDCPDDLVEICGKMMAKRPDDRFQSACEVTDVLGRWLVHHGFSQPEELGLKASDGTEDEFSLASFSLVGDPLNATGLGSRNDDIRNGVGIGSENMVNLFGSGSLVGQPEGTGAEDEFLQPPGKEVFLSQRFSEQSKKHIDPLELALDDIETGKHITRDAQQVQPVKVAPLMMTRTPHADSPAAAPPSGRPVRPVHPMANPGRESREESWYHKVPLWFWAVFAAGYILAIFMGGILFALLMKLNQ